MGSNPTLSAISTTAATLGLTAIFARLEGTPMAAFGATPDRCSAIRFLGGFAGGLLVVAVWAAVSYAIGAVRWTHTVGVDLRTLTITIASYILLASREELAFRGYPLRVLNRTVEIIRKSSAHSASPGMSTALCPAATLA